MIMDTSETYIKMCEKAEEIQKEHILHDDDFSAIWYPTGSNGTTIMGEYKVSQALSIGIWLPRQDQLQEMVEINPAYKANLKRKAAILALEFAEYVQELPHNEIVDKSTEQLWLAFVMKDNNKVWNGEDWVVSKVEAIK